MILSKQNLASIRNNPAVVAPADAIFSLPEKVLQFGTGVLLRGLPDHFIDKANRQGLFNGRVVVVKSTSTGGTDAFNTQDGLFTLCIRGIDGSNKVDEMVINSSISRVLSAKEEWSEILKCAANPEMQIVISNTTEVGIRLVEDDINAAPPVSFPGKLLAFLLARYKAFNGSAESGMVIIPTELIIGNGTELKRIVLELAKMNALDADFVNWLNTANDFCNSLVDRIVPGKLPAADSEEAEKKIGYKDELMIMSECYSLWAIETSSQRTKDILSFSKADKGVVIAEDISLFRELKLRLLNGAHTFTCGLAFLSGFKIVKEAMDDASFLAFITSLMNEEIVPAITGKNLPASLAHEFAGKVIDRFRNPYIQHQWLSITVQYSSKMKMRNVPVIGQYYQNKGTVPQRMALGFAAYMLFMKTEKNAEGQFIGQLNGQDYTVQDDHAGVIQEIWERAAGPEDAANKILKESNLWGTDLSQMEGFSKAVISYLQSFIKDGVVVTLRKFIKA